MLGTLWEWMKGLLQGKGAVQVGKGNQSVSGVTTGDVSGSVVIVIGDGLRNSQSPQGPVSTPFPEDASTNEEPTKRPSLSELEFGALVVVGKERRATARKVASALHVTEEKAKLFLDELDRKHRLVDWYGSMDNAAPESYRLTHNGRGLLIERGVF